ncbi:outer membrane protein assembly factor BamA [Rhodoplanes sp. SY1]|uniref:outer membrane protein assembly factor BamA n=1 Tax=Rhodoplanes sp. SY1 TaxID=3166646 RepID=UPI0038B5A55C
MALGLKANRTFFAIALMVAQTFTAGVVATVSVTPVQAQSASQIVVEGNRRVEADTIRSYFRTGPGERLDAAKIDEALKSLYATGLFQDVRITPSGGRIVVTVVENQVLNRVAFEGNRKIKDEQLSTEVQSKPRGTFSRAIVQADTQRIVDIYQRAGRYDVRVEPKVIELPNGRVDLVFEVDEGGKTGVAKIVFVGNKAFSDWRLKDVVKTGETNWLSWLKSNDIFDPDRVEVDRDLIRRFYLRSGFADVRVVSAISEYDPSRKGFIITFTIDEGDRYKFGSVEIQSSVRNINVDQLRARLRTKPGGVYNADAVEKTVEDLTVEVAKLGYPFANIRPRGDRDFNARLVNVVYVMEEGQRAYIERINIRGNTRTRDYVIRREFDIVEGDAYNRALIDRAERRIKNLNYFKSVRITNEPGSAPDRVIVNVDVEEQATGEFSVSGGYSTADGFIGEVSVGERNLLGRGHVARASLTYGQRSRGFELSFVEPYLMGQRLAFGVDVFGKETTSTSYYSYTSSTLGGNLKLGIPITDNLSIQPRYTGYRQEIELSNAYNNCNNLNPNWIDSFPTTLFYGQSPATTYQGVGTNMNCYADGEASLAVRRELANGPVFVSALGATLSYNTLDNNKNPANGLLVTVSEDFAGVGGDVNYSKTTIDTRLYNEILPDVVGSVRVQGGFATGWGGESLRMLDHFQGGPNLVRGFQTAGWGPRDITPGTNQDALGGSMYWAVNLEVQTPLFFAPKDFGMKLAVFADAGQLTNYEGPTSWAARGLVMTCPGQAINTQNPMANVPCYGDDNMIRSSVGVGLIWASPFGPLRFDLAYPISYADYDKKQIFRFGGGTKF